MEKQPREEATDSAIELVIAAERQRCIDRVLTYATLRDQAAVNLDKAADGPGPEKPSEVLAGKVEAVTPYVGPELPRRVGGKFLTIF